MASGFEPRRRPVLRWHGGKWVLAPWIISQFPKHRVYVEPFGGAGSVLMRKERSHTEIWNDLDDEVVNLFGVLRSEAAPRLVEQLRLTPYSRVEFRMAHVMADDPVERARRLVVRSFMGFGSNAPSRITGFRANSNKSGNTPAHDWANYPDALAVTIERLTGVVIENRDAVKVMEQHDCEEALHYVDPPYLMDTRSDVRKDYAHELTRTQHASLLDLITSLKGAVVLSGYPSELYDTALAGWSRIERGAYANGASRRTEVLWINPWCKDQLDSARAA